MYITEDNDSLNETEETPKQTIVKVEHNYEENRIADSTIISGIKGLSYVKNVWKKDTLFSFGEDYTLKTMRKISDSALIVLTRNSVSNQIQFFEISINGKISHDTILTGNYSDLLDINNFISNADKGRIYYKTNLQGELYCYNYKNKQHEQVLEHDTLNLNFKRFSSWYEDNTFKAKNGLYSVNINFFDLKLIDHEKDITYDFLTTDFEVPGAYWCFGLGSWNEDCNKFYFDNSGEMACIWEINLVDNTLDKIVPEHEAEMPICIGGIVYYCENNMIKKATFIEKGEVIKQSYGLEEAIVYDESHYYEDE